MATEAKLSVGAMDALRRLVARHRTNADPPDLTALAAIATETRLARGARLLVAGERARLAGFVVDGLVGEFYELADGKRKAKWLAKPGDLVGSLEDLVHQGPARASIEVLADALVVCVPYPDLRALAVSSPAWAGFFIAVIEGLYRRKSEREFTLLMLKAEERYRWFRSHYAELEDQLSQETVASYLGITPVHLSRVRASTGGRARSGRSNRIRGRVPAPD